MNKIKFCSECGARSYKNDVCTNCGLVFEDRPIVNNIPLDLNAEEKKRVFKSTVLGQISKTNIINTRECKSPELRRALRNSQRFLLKSWDVKRDSIIKKEIKRIVNLLNGTKDLYISSFYRYKKMPSGMFKGHSLETIAQTIVFLEIKLEGLPYNLSNFEKIGCNKDNIKTYYKKLFKEIDFRIKQPHPKIFINRIVNKLSLEEREKTLVSLACLKLLENIKKLGLKQTNPVVECGACLYIITLISQKIIYEIIGCSDKALRNKLYEIKGIINRIKVFGVDDYDLAKKTNEYTPFSRNVAKFLEIDGLLSKCLINFNYEMKYENNRLKAVFYCTN